MYDGEQLVQVRWNPTTSQHYLSLGYDKHEHNELFYVKAKDLMPHSGAEIIAVCDYCGAEYPIKLINLIEARTKLAKDACRHCAKQKAWEVGLKQRAEEQYQKAKEFCDSKGYTLLSTPDDYKNGESVAQYICPSHGVIDTTFRKLVVRHGCRKCRNEYTNDFNRRDISETNAIIESYGAKWLNPEDYQTVNTRNLLIQCSCGEIYTTSFTTFIDTAFRCPKCTGKMSVGEYCVRKYLLEHDIKFIYQHKFDDCRNINPLPFDFYLYELNIIIEFDGPQHYKDLHFKGQYEYTAERDAIKNKYCYDNGITLIRIPYWDRKRIPEILDEKLGLQKQIAI